MINTGSRRFPPNCSPSDIKYEYESKERGEIISRHQDIMGRERGRIDDNEL